MVLQHFRCIGDLGAIFASSSVIFRRSWTIFDELGPILGDLGPSWGHLGPSWCRLAAILVPSWGPKIVIFRLFLEQFRSIGDREAIFASSSAIFCPASAIVGHLRRSWTDLHSLHKGLGAGKGTIAQRPSLQARSRQGHHRIRLVAAERVDGHCNPRHGAQPRRP